MEILVAEANVVGRNQLIQMLEIDGHRVRGAATWEELSAAFIANCPDVLFVASDLTDLPSGEFIGDLKRYHPARFVPAVLATSIHDSLTLGRFLDSGADDFIDQPYVHMVVKAKVAGFTRLAEVYRRLEKFRDATEHEIRIARHMFERVTGKRPTDVGNLRHWSLAAGHFSGDLLIFERTPDNCLNVLLGDFTGHGLAAAIGALPAADVFYAMTRKGYGVESIAGELNRKLYGLLPTGHFCSACLIGVNPQEGRVEVWNGGLPPVLLADDQRTVLHSVASSGLPLGILAPDEFHCVALSCALSDVAHIIAYSDGLVEAQNAHGHQFGENRLSAALSGARLGHCVVEAVKQGVIAFLDGLEPHDDISLLAIDLGAAG